MAKPRGTTGRAGSRLRTVAGSTVRGRPRAAPGRTIQSCDDGPPPAVEVEEPAPRTLLLRVRGTFDEAADLEMTRILDDRLGAPGVTRVVIDLVGVATLTSTGVSTLHRLHRACRVTGLHLVLVGTANPAVHRYLYLTGLLPLVDARPTVQAALQVQPSTYRPGR
jgi:anti-anti-sigma factor